MTTSSRSTRTRKLSAPKRLTPSGGKKSLPEAPIRYAVVGLGHIAQAAVLPAFDHAKKSSVLRALVSDDAAKLRRLGRRYSVKALHSYAEYDGLLSSGEIDAVYITLPNHLHREYTERAARAGVNVLCEKPMAVTAKDCQAMIRACEENTVRLMIAYRLHFEGANLQAAELAQNGRIGEPRIFSSVFTMQVKPGDIRLRRETGGGVLYDIGIYCINVARMLYRAEPIEAFAFSASTGEARFREVDEMTTAVLRYPDERLASFTVSFGGADVSTYRVVGTTGDLRVEPAYQYADDLVHHLTRNGQTGEKVFKKRDQFGAELDYFSRCISTNAEPEPSGAEGLADVRIIEALLHSAEVGRPISLDLDPDAFPTGDQEYRLPPTEKPSPVRTESPSEN